MRIEAGTDDTTQRRHDATTTRRRRRRSDEDDDAATTTTRRGRRRGDDTAGRRGNDTECCHRNVATEMMPPKCPPRRGEAGTTTASLPLPGALTVAAAPKCPAAPPASLQCPGPHNRCSPRPRRSDPGSDSLPSVTGFRWRCWGPGGEDSGGDG